MVSAPKRTYQSWTLEDDVRLYLYVKQAKSNKKPLTRLFSEIAEEFDRKPQTIAQHYYSEIRSKEDEFEEMTGERSVMPKKATYTERDKVADSIGFPKEGAIVEGTVENVAPFGVFVRLDNELRGLLHISQISENFIEDIHALFSSGDRVTVRVESIDENGRLSFSTIGLKNQNRKKPVIDESTWEDTPTVLDALKEHNQPLHLLLAQYCELQDELRKFQVRASQLQQLIRNLERSDPLIAQVQSFVDKCLSI